MKKVAKFAIVFPFIGIAFNHDASADECFRAILMAPGGAAPYCADETCNNMDEKRRYRTGEIARVCKGDGENYSTKTSDDKIRWIKELDVSLEQQAKDGGLCFAVDVSTGIESEFFSKDYSFKGNGKWYGESLRFESRLSAKASAKMGAEINICPVVTRRFAVRPDPKRKDRSLSQRMAVNQSLPDRRRKRSESNLELKISIKPKSDAQVSFDLEAYCLEQDRRSPDPKDRLVLDHDWTKLLEDRGVVRIMNAEFESEEARGHCVWIAMNSSLYALETTEFLEEFESRAEAVTRLSESNSISKTDLAEIGDLDRTIKNTGSWIRMLSQCGRHTNFDSDFRQFTDRLHSVSRKLQSLR